MVSKHKRKIVLAVVLLLGFSTGLGCSDGGEIAGSWVLDKDKMLTTMVGIHEKELKRKISPEERKQIARTISASKCNYIFHKDGSIEIDFFMTKYSHGMESGKWKRDGDLIVVESKDIQTGKSGVRKLTLSEGQLKWVRLKPGLPDIPYYFNKN